MRNQAVAWCLSATVLAGVGCGEGGTGTPTPPALPLGAPIAAPLNTWTFVDFPDSACDDGSATGVAVNLSGGKDLLVYMMGGGACWDALTCAVLNTSTHGPFGRAQFDPMVAQISGTVLARDASNPFRDFNMVFVPYCTGDVHTGDNVATYDVFGQPKKVHHKGRANLEAFLKRLAATVKSPGKLVVSGSSAGGFGTAFNYDLFRTYYPSADGYLLDDSGPPLVGEAVPSALRTSWTASWRLDQTLLPHCPGCSSDLSESLAGYVRTYPNDHFALLSYTQDAVIRAYLGNQAPEVFQQNLYALATKVIEPSPRFHYYFATGTAHTFLGAPAKVTSVGVNLNDWLGQFIAGDANLKSIKP